MLLKAWIKSLDASFEVAIREDPWDPTNYLIYSDWCEENNKPYRAEQLRYQAGFLPRLRERFDNVIDNRVQQFLVPEYGVVDRAIMNANREWLIDQMRTMADIAMGGNVPLSSMNRNRLAETYVDHRIAEWFE